MEQKILQLHSDSHSTTNAFSIPAMRQMVCRVEDNAPVRAALLSAGLVDNICGGPLLCNRFLQLSQALRGPLFVMFQYAPKFFAA